MTSLLELVQLDWLADRYPHQLSGGQRQRIALARALAVEPRVLLLDEPFGALDARVRQELRRWLRRLHDEVHVTSVFVTHDQEEALEVADRVVVMNHGRVEQIGTPDEVYDHPATPFVVEFLGHVNRLPVADEADERGFRPPARDRRAGPAGRRRAGRRDSCTVRRSARSRGSSSRSSATGGPSTSSSRATRPARWRCRAVRSCTCARRTVRRFDAA